MKSLTEMQNRFIEKKLEERNPHYKVMNNLVELCPRIFGKVELVNCEIGYLEVRRFQTKMLKEWSRSVCLFTTKCERKEK